MVCFLIAHITPIFKKGLKVNPTNYRPVSLTSKVIKVLETLIRSKMVKYLDENEIVTNCQYGFIKKNLVLQIFCQSLRIGLQQSIKVTELILPTLTLARHLIQCPIRDLFKSWLVMALVVSCCYGLRVFSLIVTKELF